MRRAWIVVALAMAIGGCGYALAGKGSTLPDYIKRIGVPDFQNLSSTPEIDRLITDAVRQELQSRGKFQVVPEATGVDAVLTGTIRSLTKTESTFTSDQQVAKYTVALVGSAEFKETKDNKVTWNQSVRADDEFNVVSGTSGADLATLFTQDRNAFTRLAKTFAEKLVNAILENF